MYVSICLYGGHNIYMHESKGESACISYMYRHVGFPQLEGKIGVSWEMEIIYRDQSNPYKKEFSKRSREGGAPPFRGIPVLFA